MSETIISVHKLCKTVADATGELPILRDVSFQVSPQDTLAIVGASGSGKSTLLGLIAGLDTPTGGSVEVCGQDLFGGDEDARAALRARHMGFVFQSFQLLPQLSALENTQLPLELAGRRDAASAARAMLERVGLGSRLHHTPRQLSGGEQQRVALARAFVVQPDVLLADEPTGSLDAASGAAVMDLMFDLNRERGTTLLLVTHDAGMAQRCARRLTLVAGAVAD